VKDSKDLEARLPVKSRETPVRWHIDRSATGQRDIIVMLQHRKQLHYLNGIAAGQASPEKLRRRRIGKRGVGRRPSRDGNQNAPATGSGGASKEEAVDDGLGATAGIVGLPACIGSSAPILLKKWD
jgi:hypothetical protein